MARALGRYELLRPLARGGMADVYLARRRAAGIEKWLVVKRMRPETTGDPRFLELFVREARLSMSLVHQNIVPVFDFGKIDDQVFLAMERVEGKDLSASLARTPRRRLPPLLAAFIAAECCQALDYAHRRKSPDGVALGIVHRDVTPRNVLLSWSGEVKLTDFGIAALAGDATLLLIGTPMYMAPEQARSEPVDLRADIYSIGLVLREAVTGIRPRPGTDRESILEAARRADLLPWSPLPGPGDPPAGIELALGTGVHDPEPAPPPPAGEPADDPPAGLVAIIDRATAALPDDRYPDARAMLEELDSFIVSQRAAHKAESPARQLAAWLADVWEGARDDADNDAAIQAEHLVSFLDDGAFDVAGIDTFRSLAATAGDLHGQAVVPPSPLLAVGTPPLAAALAGAPPVPSTGLIPRTSRISSSHASTASGSFHTVSPRDGRRDRATGPSPTMQVGSRAPRQIRPLLNLVLVAVAVGAAAYLFTSRNRDHRASSQPPLAAGQTAAGPEATGTPGQPASGQPASGQQAAGQQATGQQAAGRQAAGQPATGQPATGQPATRQPATGQPATGQANSARPTGGSSTGRPTSGSSTGRPTSGHPATGQANLERPAGGQQASEGPAPGQSAAQPGGSPVPGASGSDRAKPVMCRVRINLTPWAYYTADGDGTRHETPGVIDLSPGRHRLHVWNPELHVERDITIDVPADRDTMNYSEPLQPSTLPVTPAPSR